MVLKSSSKRFHLRSVITQLIQAALVFDHFKTVQPPTVDRLEQQQRNRVLLDIVNLSNDQLFFVVMTFYDSLESNRKYN